MSNTIFLNSDYIVIEYIDIIKSPYIVLLNHIRRNKRIREILNLEEIDNLGEDGLIEWYINRKHQNFLIDLCRYPDRISESDLDVLLDEQMSYSNRWFTDTTFLNIQNLLSNQIQYKYAKDILIYYPHSNMYAKTDLSNKFGTSFTFMNDFNEIIDIAGHNSTYFLSDINKIYMLKDKGKLEMSSITLPYEYRYNKKNLTEFNIDFKSLFEEHPFKLSYMRVCTEILE